LAGLPAPALFGTTQLDNASTAIAALEALEPRLRIPDAAVAAGLRSAQLPARFQIIDPAPAGDSGEPRWILDVAHNPAAAAVLARNLRDLPCAGRTFAVFGVLADKDARGVVEALAPVIDHWWLAGTEGPRGLSDAQVAERVGSLIPARFTCGVDFQRCCEAARAAAGAGDRIVAFGSFHSVGPVLDWLEAHALVPAARIPEYNADLFAPR
jgi:dihydrofolate synthase/folylpolyglutamate synthase